ncbi:hypothetical protein DERF_003976 [Dermatophagoides farinae]|uniref:Uncharacterized protein n=1 Tax=Dermatophagoides farinae TaxID=6954 RepID=A0A922IDN0_DERFA|nr:hypothetical protein DERF_003976 [Dermatophagoides farinae]
MHDDWHTNTPSLRSSTKIPFIWPHDITTLDSNHDHHDHHHHEELTPLRLEYTLPPVFDQRQIILNEEDIFEPHTDIQNTNKNTLMAPYQQFTSSHHHHHHHHHKHRPRHLVGTTLQIPIYFELKKFHQI